MGNRGGTKRDLIRLNCRFAVSLTHIKSKGKNTEEENHCSKFFSKAHDGPPLYLNVRNLLKNRRRVFGQKLLDVDDNPWVSPVDFQTGCPNRQRSRRLRCGSNINTHGFSSQSHDGFGFGTVGLK